MPDSGDQLQRRIQIIELEWQKGFVTIYQTAELETVEYGVAYLPTNLL